MAFKPHGRTLRFFSYSKLSLATETSQMILAEQFTVHLKLLILKNAAFFPCTVMY